MAVVLLTNEFGSGLGHVNRLIAVAKRLNSTNTLVFALPNIRAMGAVVTHAFGQRAILRSGAEWVAPTDPNVRTIATHTLSDVMRLFRYDDKAILIRAVEGWRTLLDEVKPDLIVADFSPTLRLAVGDNIPTIVVGNGYTIPPPGRLLPPIRPWQSEVPATSLAGERRLLNVINELCTKSGSPAINYVADLFSGLKTFVCTINEFDPYRSYRTELVRWPFNVPSILPGPSAPERSGPAIFTYLPASHPLIENVIRSINDLEFGAHLYISGAKPQDIARHCGRHVGVLTKPADFSAILPKVRLLIHHAGLGTAYAGLAAGTPQLVLPLNLEHLITSRGLASVGVAMGFTKSLPDPGALSNAIKALLTEPAWMARAATRATALAESKDPDPLAEIIEACTEITMLST